LTRHQHGLKLLKLFALWSVAGRTIASSGGRQSASQASTDD
jgi:hypothetical protein